MGENQRSTCEAEVKSINFLSYLICLIWNDLEDFCPEGALLFFSRLRREPTVYVRSGSQIEQIYSTLCIIFSKMFVILNIFAYFCIR